MAQVTLPPFIQSISGQVGNITFRAYASGKTGFYLSPTQKRNTPVTKAEKQARELFAQRVQHVNNIMRENPYITRKQAWTIVKQLPS